MRNETINSLSGFIITLAILALLGAGCASTARADSRSLACYDRAAQYVENNFRCLDGPRGGDKVCKAKRQREVFAKCLRRTPVVTCTTDADCAAKFGGEY
jgi:hypothetical protein